MSQPIMNKAYAAWRCIIQKQLLECKLTSLMTPLDLADCDVGASCTRVKGACCSSNDGLNLLFEVQSLCLIKQIVFRSTLPLCSDQ